MPLPEGVETTQHRAIEGTRDGVERALLTAFRGLRRALSDQEAVAMALDTRILLPLDLRERMQEVLGPALEQAHLAAQQAVASDLKVAFEKAEAVGEGVEIAPAVSEGVVLDLAQPTPRSIAYAARRAGRLVTNIDKGQRAAIRTVVERAIREGGNPREIAPLIQQVIGLNERQANALMNQRQRMFERGLPPSRIESETRAYATRALRSRAEMIARTEVLDAMNAGVDDGWGSMIERGLLDPALVEREWIVTWDERTCDICAPLDGVRAPVGETFDGYDRPPAHPRCRCTMGMVRRESAPSSQAYSTPPSAPGTSYRRFPTTSAGDEWARKQWRSTSVDLDDLELAALDRYREGGYGQINGALRTGDGYYASNFPAQGTPMNYAADAVEVLDDAFRKAPSVAEDVTTYRGVKGEFAERLRTGQVDEFIDHGYVSTTMDAERAASFGPTMVEVRVPKGTRGIYVDAVDLGRDLGEKELVLDRGTRWRVVERDEVSNRVVIEMVEQGPTRTVPLPEGMLAEFHVPPRQAASGFSFR